MFRSMWFAGLAVPVVLVSTLAGADDDDIDKQSLKEGLVAHWPMNGNAKDKADDKMHGAMCGPTATEGHSGPGSLALEFDGVNDYIDLSDAMATVNALGSGSISMWFRVDQAPDQQPNRALGIPAPDQLTFPGLYMGKVDPLNGNNSLMVHPIHPNARPTVWFTIVRNMKASNVPPYFCFDTCYFPPDQRLNNATSCSGPGEDLIVADEWYHYVVTVDASGNHGYLNGEDLQNRRFNPNRERPPYNNTTLWPAGPGAPAEATDVEFFDDVLDPTDFTIGKGTWGYAQFERFFAGAIDEVRIYDRVLSADEVAVLFEEPWTEDEEEVEELEETDSSCVVHGNANAYGHDNQDDELDAWWL
jgi:Concanavalin A-like lectin/glucanases superfamily